MKVIDVVFGAVLSIPMLYALYQYSSSSDTVWEETHFDTLKTRLSGLLESSKELKTSVITSTTAGDVKTTVPLKNKDNELVVKIQKEINTEPSAFILALCA